jgi:hypothetical protein
MLMLELYVVVITSSAVVSVMQAINEKDVCALHASSQHKIKASAGIQCCQTKRPLPAQAQSQHRQS